jgi:hypothetical protein
LSKTPKKPQKTAISKFFTRLEGCFYIVFCQITPEGGRLSLEKMMRKAQNQPPALQLMVASWPQRLKPSPCLTAFLRLAVACLCAILYNARALLTVLFSESSNITLDLHWVVQSIYGNG